MTMLELSRKTEVGDDDRFTDREVTILSTEECDLPDKHLIKVTACWRGMSSTDAPTIVTLSITDKGDAHKQEQSHRIDTESTGQAGGEMSRVLKVLARRGDITPGPNLFKLKAVRALGNGAVQIQAAAKYPIEIRVEDLGVIPTHLL